MPPMKDSRVCVRIGSREPTKLPAVSELGREGREDKAAAAASTSVGYVEASKLDGKKGGDFKPSCNCCCWRSKAKRAERSMVKNRPKK